VGWSRNAYAASLSRALPAGTDLQEPGAYRRRRVDPAGLKLPLRELAHSRPRFGYRRLHVMLRREGWAINMKRVRRLPAIAQADATTQTHEPAPRCGASSDPCP
jgi:transposase InsO family protein